MAILWFLLLALALIVLAIVFALVFERSEKNMLFSGLETVLFLVMMPKNELKKDDSRAQEEKILISQLMKDAIHKIEPLAKAKYITFKNNAKYGEIEGN